MVVGEQSSFECQVLYLKGTQNIHSLVCFHQAVFTHNSFFFSVEVIEITKHNITHCPFELVQTTTNIQ